MSITRTPYCLKAFTVEKKTLFRLFIPVKKSARLSKTSCGAENGRLFCVHWNPIPHALILGIGQPWSFISKLGGPGWFVIGSKGDQPSRAGRLVAQSERHQFRLKLPFLASRRKGLADKDFSSAREFLGFPP